MPSLHINIKDIRLLWQPLKALNEFMVCLSAHIFTCEKKAVFKKLRLYETLASTNKSKMMSTVEKLHPHNQWISICQQFQIKTWDVMMSFLYTRAHTHINTHCGCLWAVLPFGFFYQAQLCLWLQLFFFFFLTFEGRQVNEPICFFFVFFKNIFTAIILKIFI